MVTFHIVLISELPFLAVCACTGNGLQESTNLFGEVQKWLTVTDVELLNEYIHNYLESCHNSTMVYVLRGKLM